MIRAYMMCLFIFKYKRDFHLLILDNDK